MRTLWTFAVLAVAGCSELHTHGPVTPLDLDIVVTASSVRVITNGTDRGLCDDENLMFPDLDACVVHDDSLFGCWATCLESAMLVGSGLSLSGLSSTGIDFRLSEPLPANAALELTGCGAAAERIPIEASAVTSPVVTIQSTADTVQVHWTADEAAESAIVNYAFSNSGTQCRTAATDHSHTSPVAGERARQVGVTTLLAPVTTTTALGAARVWRGSTTFANVE